MNISSSNCTRGEARTPDVAVQSILRQTHHVDFTTDVQHGDLLDAEMLDVLSANLREPLAIMKGYADTLLQRGDRLSREERREFLIAIVDASERFERVLQSFLPANPHSSYTHFDAFDRGETPAGDWR
jgi:K+-sensing histidine kinase KdpD